MTIAHNASTSTRKFSSTGPSTSGISLRTPAGQVPASILEDEHINAAIRALLPANYNFEIHKTIHHIRHYRSACVALQMPEGLTLWATAISDIVERFTEASTVIMGDVTYGACCVDDYTARSLGADTLVHYGHSCLVPVDQTSIRTLYVFVEIAIDPAHLHSSIRSNFPTHKRDFRNQLLQQAQQQSQQACKGKAKVEVDIEEGKYGVDGRTHLVLVATVQFINSLQEVKERLRERGERLPDALSAADVPGRGLSIEASPHDESLHAGTSCTFKSLYTGSYQVTIPQIKPLSPGEILGCTSPKLPLGEEEGVDAIIYVGDGRFHLESIMIANPRIPAFRYDPYEKRFVREWYDHKGMRSNRSGAVEIARLSLQRESNLDFSAAQKGWGLILGTLGRQGSTKVLTHLAEMIKPSGVAVVPILLSELSPQKLALFGTALSVFVQTSCPRLSIDWGDAFDRPLLSPYEAAVTLERIEGWTAEEKDLRREDQGDGKRQSGDYLMDFYADQSSGPWTPRHGVGGRTRNTNGISNRDLLKRGKQKPSAVP